MKYFFYLLAVFDILSGYNERQYLNLKTFLEAGSPLISIHRQVKRMILFSLRRWWEVGRRVVDTLFSLLMQFGVKGLLLGGGSIVTGKSRHRREAELRGDTFFCTPSPTVDWR